MGTEDALPSSGPDPRPRFVDNRDGNTLDAALRAYLRALREGQEAGNVNIATAYFNLPGFDLLAEKLIPDGDGNVVLTLARYQPENYPAGGAEIATDTAIVGRLRSGLSKRFESSVNAFAETTRKMVREHDLPWNPMRLVQRHGRVDRIGSRPTQVFLRTFFPDAQLDELLNLEARVRGKLAQAAASVGVEVLPIAGGAEGQQSFSETREEIEKLAKNDASIYERVGTESAPQTGEEYRQELRKAMLKRAEEILELPWKAGSGMAKGKRRGHFFCAQVGKRVYLRFVPLDTAPH